MNETANTKLRISVVIPTKNEGHRLGLTLLALRLQTRSPDEVVVVDAHSPDNTAAVAESHGARVVFENYGTRAGGCQVGVEVSKGDLVAFTDADCIPDPHWLEELSAHLDVNVAGVGGRIVNEGDTFWERSVDAALDTLVGSANSVQGRPFATPRNVSSISGCNSLYRRHDLVEVGGFRTDLTTTEDTELNRRVRRLGPLVYTPAAVVRHRHQRGLRAFAKRMHQYGYGRGQSLLIDPPLLLPFAAVALVFLALVLPWFALALLAVYAVVLFLSAVRPARRVRDPRYLASVPLILFLEHASYITGFWIGLWKTRIIRSRRRAVSGVHPD